MSDRSLFPEGCAVHQRHLENESDQRIADVTRIVSGQSSTGVVSGLVVSVNPGDGTKIDVTAGSAFSPAGSYMTLGTGRTGLTLALNTLGAKNYVLLVYDEAQSDQESHTSDGTLRYTKATNSPRVIVLTDSAYAALPPSDSVLSNNARDRATILAVITATGGVLSATDIASPPSFSPVLGATIQNTLPGVTALLIGAGTNTGTGSLYWDGSGFLTWTAPGDTAGTPVAVSTSQAYTLTSGGGYTFKVDIAFSVLPITAATANVTVYDVYSQTASRMSLKDSYHRSLVGSGTPSANNPHGMTLDDLSPGAAGSLEEHQDVMHTDGIGRGSSNGLLAVTVNTGPAPDSMTIAGFSTGDSAYINGRRVTAIVGSNTIAAPVTASMTTEQVYISQDGTVGTRSFAVHGTLDLTNRIQILNLVGVPSGTCQIRYTNTGAISLGIGGTFGFAQQAPSVDSMIRVAWASPAVYADLWVKSGSAPGATITETVTVSNPPSVNGLMVVATVPWSGSASGFLGYGYGAGNAPNGAYDLRVHGTLDISDVSSASGIDRSADFVKSAMSDGLLYDVSIPPGTGNNNLTYGEAVASQHVMSASGLLFTYYAGPAVIGGRYVITTPVINQALVDNTVNRIYLSSTGIVQSSVQSWDNIAAAQLGKPYLQLAEVTTVAGTSTLLSLRSFTGYRKDQPTGVVGLDGNGTATILSTLNNADSLIIQNNTTGNGITVDAAAIAIQATSPTGIAISAFATQNAAISAASAQAEAIYAEGGTNGGIGAPAIDALGGAGAGSDGPGLRGTGGGTTGSGVTGIAATASGYGLESTQGHVGVPSSRDFKYTAAKTGIITVNATSLVLPTAYSGSSSLARVAGTPFYWVPNSGAATGYTAQVNLPRGSIIQEASMIYSKSTTGVSASYATMTVYSHGTSAGSQIIHGTGALSAGNGVAPVTFGSNTLTMTDLTPQSTGDSGVVSHYQCYVTLDIPAGDTNIKIYGIAFRYTTTVAGFMI